MSAQRVVSALRARCARDKHNREVYRCMRQDDGKVTYTEWNEKRVHTSNQVSLSNCIAVIGTTQRPPKPTEQVVCYTSSTGELFFSVYVPIGEGLPVVEGSYVAYQFDVQRDVAILSKHVKRVPYLPKDEGVKYVICKADEAPAGYPLVRLKGTVKYSQNNHGMVQRILASLSQGNITDIVACMREVKIKGWLRKIRLNPWFSEREYVTVEDIVRYIRISKVASSSLLCRMRDIDPKFWQDEYEEDFWDNDKVGQRTEDNATILGLYVVSNNDVVFGTKRNEVSKLLCECLPKIRLLLPSHDIIACFTIGSNSSLCQLLDDLCLRFNDIMASAQAPLSFAGSRPCISFSAWMHQYNMHPLFEDETGGYDLCALNYRRYERDGLYVLNQNGIQEYGVTTKTSRHWRTNQEIEEPYSLLSFADFKPMAVLWSHDEPGTQQRAGNTNLHPNSSNAASNDIANQQLISHALFSPDRYVFPSSVGHVRARMGDDSTTSHPMPPLFAAEGQLRKDGHEGRELCQGHVCDRWGYGSDWFEATPLGGPRESGELDSFITNDERPMGYKTRNLLNDLEDALQLTTSYPVKICMRLNPYIHTIYTPEMSVCGTCSRVNHQCLGSSKRVSGFQWVLVKFDANGTMLSPRDLVPPHKKISVKWSGGRTLETLKTHFSMRFRGGDASHREWMKSLLPVYVEIALCVAHKDGHETVDEEYSHIINLQPWGTTPYAKLEKLTIVGKYGKPTYLPPELLSPTQIILAMATKLSRPMWDGAALGGRTMVIPFRIQALQAETMTMTVRVKLITQGSIVGSINISQCRIYPQMFSSFTEALEKGSALLVSAGETAQANVERRRVIGKLGENYEVIHGSLLTADEYRKKKSFGFDTGFNAPLGQEAVMIPAPFIKRNTMKNIYNQSGSGESHVDAMLNARSKVLLNPARQEQLYVFGPFSHKDAQTAHAKKDFKHETNKRKFFDCGTGTSITNEKKINGGQNDGGKPHAQPSLSEDYVEMTGYRAAAKSHGMPNYGPTCRHGMKHTPSVGQLTFSSNRGDAITRYNSMDMVGHVLYKRQKLGQTHGLIGEETGFLVSGLEQSRTGAYPGIKQAYDGKNKDPRPAHVHRYARALPAASGTVVESSSSGDIRVIHRESQNTGFHLTANTQNVIEGTPLGKEIHEIYEKAEKKYTKAKK